MKETMWQVANWDANFETHKTRILKRLDFVLIPNKMDGDGYTELLDHPNGAAHFGVWIALIEIASKAPIRGQLTREITTRRSTPGAHPAVKAHDAASLSRISRIPAGLIEEALERLHDIGWIEPLSPSKIQEAAQSGDNPAISGADPAETGRSRRTERNGTEGNGIERNGTEPALPPDPELPPEPDRDSSVRPSGGRSTGEESPPPGPIVVPDKPMAAPKTPKSPDSLSPERISGMRELLHDFMCNPLPNREPRHAKPPDSAIVDRCVLAVGDTPIANVAEYLRSLQQTYKIPEGGPRSYAWFESTLRTAFGAAEVPT